MNAPGKMEAEIDARVCRLVDVLNAFPGVQTHGSCGGHPAPLKGGQWPEGTFYVKLRIDLNEAAGRKSLEALAWAINQPSVDGPFSHFVTFKPTAPPPLWNGWGGLSFLIEAEHLAGFPPEDPDRLADFLDAVRAEHFDKAIPLDAGPDADERSREMTRLLNDVAVRRRAGLDRLPGDDA